MDYTLIAPGPTPLPPSVYKKLSEPVIHHRTAAFAAAFASCLSRLKTVARTKSADAFMMTCSGTGAMESAVVNLLSPGDRALVCDSGSFGDRFVKIIRTYGLEPQVVCSEWGRAIDPEALKAALSASAGIKAVFLQHTDTSTGIVNDLKTLARVVRDHSDAAVVVDSISGIAAEELEMDVWDLDVVISGSQKGLMGPPGLAFACVSKFGWELVQKARLPRFYFDWRTMKDNVPKGQTPYTPAVNIVLAQDEALRLIVEEGIENVWKRTAALAAYVRSETLARGWSLYAKDPADILTGIVLPTGMDGQKLIEDILAEENISIAGGQEKLFGKIVRIAHMGFISKKDVDLGFAALDKRLAAVKA